MKIAVVASNEQWEEINYGTNHASLIRIPNVANIPNDVDVLMLLSEPIPLNIKLVAKLILLNAVYTTLKEMNASENIIRINGRKDFLCRKTWEVAGKINELVQEVFTVLGKQFITVPDTPGFVSAREIAMIINEAYFALIIKLAPKKKLTLG